MASLPREFYNGDTVEIAQKLLGKYLVCLFGTVRQSLPRLRL